MPLYKQGRELQSCNEECHKSGNQGKGTLLSRHAWVLLALGTGVDCGWKPWGRLSAILSTHWLQNIPQDVLVDLGGDHQALGEEQLGRELPLLWDDPNDHDGGGNVGVLYDDDLIYFLADPLVVLLAALPVLVEVLLTREEPEHSGKSRPELVEEASCFDLSWLLGCLCNEHAVRIAVNETTNVLLDRLVYIGLVAVYFSGNCGKAVTPITVDVLFRCSDELVGPDSRKSNSVGFGITG